MNPTVIILVTLAQISLMLTVILSIAWHAFGRPRYALTWAVAFGLAFIKWAGLLIVVRSDPADQSMFSLIRLSDCFIMALIAIGFLQRSMRRPFASLLLGSAAIAAGVATLMADPAWRNAIPLLHSTLMIVFSMVAVRRRGQALNAAEMATLVVLAAFVLLNLSAMLIGLDLDERPSEQFILLLLLGLPSAFAGTGLFAVFLIAADLADRMRRLADSDPLTGVLNRRGFEDQANRAIALARRHGQALSVAVADLDRFKSINDRYGHAVGDAALRQFADHVQQTIRSTDLFGRMGGEEFAVVLVNSSASSAADVLNRLRVQVSELPRSPDKPFVMTASFGVTELDEQDADVADMLDRADRALYLSKIGGRNRVTLAESGLSLV